MAKAQMKVFKKLQQHEQQVKRTVLQEIRQSDTERAKRKPYIWITSAFIMIITLLFIVSFKPNDSKVTADSDIILHELPIDQLQSRTPYYFAVPLEWTGDESVNVYAYDLLDESGYAISYEKHHVAMRAFDGDDTVVPGVYSVDDLIPSDDFAHIMLQPQEQNIVLFEMYFGDEFDISSNYTLKLVYGEDKEKLVEWPLLNKFTFQSLDATQYIDRLSLTDEEREAYEHFKVTEDRKVLRHLQPISMMKLYYAAAIEGETKLQYELYTKQPERVMWHYEDQLQFSPLDQLSAEAAVEQVHRYAAGQFVQASDKEGYIESFYGDIKVFFNMVKDDDLWAVSFLPIQ